MGFLDRFFKHSNNSKDELFNLYSIHQLDSIIQDSNHRTQLIFKHSTRCSVSRFVLNNFIANYSSQADDFDIHILDLLNYREISQLIAKTFNLQHESPQLLIIRDSTLIHHASHEAIASVDLQQFL